MGSSLARHPGASRGSALPARVRAPQGQASRSSACSLANPDELGVDVGELLPGWGPPPGARPRSGTHGPCASALVAANAVSRLSITIHSMRGAPAPSGATLRVEAYVRCALGLGQQQRAAAQRLLWQCGGHGDLGEHSDPQRRPHCTWLRAGTPSPSVGSCVRYRSGSSGWRLMNTRELPQLPAWLRMEHFEELS